MNDDNEAELVAAGAIPLLVALLGPKRTATVREAAAGALMNLITNADSTAKLVAAGGIPPLVALLGAKGMQVAAAESVQEAAADTLRRIAFGSDNQVKVAAAGAIPRLVALLGTKRTAAVQEAAAGALWSLAHNNAGNMVKISTAGATPPWWHFWVLRTRQRYSCRRLGPCRPLP